MNRGNYTQKKRQREADRARKKQEKDKKRAERRERGPAQIEFAAPEEMTGELPSIEQAMFEIEQRATATREAPSVPCRLFVGSLSQGTTVQGLASAFSEYGEVIDAFIVNDRDTGRSRGFGFVTMEGRKQARTAIESLDGSELDGRTIVVNVATERPR